MDTRAKLGYGASGCERGGTKCRLDRCIPGGVIEEATRGSDDVSNTGSEGQAKVSGGKRSRGPHMTVHLYGQQRVGDHDREV